jgi:hypothetical protein
VPNRIFDLNDPTLSRAAAPFGKNRLQFGPEVTVNRQHRGPTGYEEGVLRCLGRGFCEGSTAHDTHVHAGVRIREKST